MILVQKRDWNVGLIFIMGVIFFTLGIHKPEVISFESRFYLFAMEMWRHGPTWFATTYHHPYPDYPGTSTFIIYVISKMIGELSRFSAVLPSALISAATLAMTYMIGALYDKKWGVSAVCFLLLTYAFVAEARTISLDQYTTFATVTCFYLANTKRSHWVYPFFILSFMMRGPIGLVIPVSVVSVVYLLDRNFKQFFFTGIVSALLLILSCSCLLGLAYHEEGMPFVKQIINMQVVGRLNEVVNLPWHYYISAGMAPYAVIYPLAALSVIAIAYVPSAHRMFLWKLVGWALVIVVGLSIPTNKKIRYLLPFAPALALLCGYFYTANIQNRYIECWKRSIYGFFLIFPTFCLFAIIFVYYRYPELLWNTMSLVTFFTIMQCMMMVFVYYQSKFKHFAILMLASICFWLAYIGVVEPIQFFLHRTQYFVREVEYQRQRVGAKLLFYRENSDGVSIKYVVNMLKDEDPVFISSLDELSNNPHSLFIVTSEKNYHEIPVHYKNKYSVFFKGQIGRKPFVVMVKNNSMGYEKKIS